MKKTHLSPQKIFITGGAGFIGANFTKYLLDKGGFDVTVYDNLSAGSKANLRRAIRGSKQKGNVKFVKSDILDNDKLNRTIKGHSAVVHLAANTEVIKSLKTPKENFTVNTVGTFNVLEAARKNKIKKFIFASSNAAVGEQIPPINEKMLPRPLAPYGANKLCGEALCSAYYYSYGLETVCLRFANAYGPYSNHKTSVIVKFIKKVKQGKPLEVYGDGNQTRDFVHASDICQAIYLALNYDLIDSDTAVTPVNLIFQIASGTETRIKDLAKMISDFAVLLHRSPPEIRYSSPKRGEIRENFSDIKKARASLNYNPSVKLKEGLKNTWEWFNEKRI